MPRLDRPRRNDLSVTDFELYPVWTWNDGMDYLLPVDPAESAHESTGDTLLIKADFCVGQHRLDGYVIGNGSYYAFGLFIGGREVVLNANLPDLMIESCRNIAKLLSVELEDLFPLTYESPVRLAGLPPVRGEVFAPWIDS
jgi:hypothetical protein